MAKDKKSKTTRKTQPKAQKKATLREDKKAPAKTPAAGPLLPPREIDVTQFEAAYGRVLPQAQALSAVSPFNVDLQVASLVALKVAQAVSAPALRQRFSNLARSGEFKDAPVEALADLAMATWYARYRGIHADTSSAGPPPTELSSRGFKLRGQMLRVLEYNLEDNAEVMKKVAIIRTGSGYLDLANDLKAVADLYTEHAKELAGDQRRYRAEDAVEAQQVASALLTYLGSGVDAPKVGWTEIQARCWTLLDQAYSEVRRGGIFLYPGEEGERLFPLLVAATRELTGSSTPESPKAPAPPPPKPLGSLAL